MRNSSGQSVIVVLILVSVVLALIGGLIFVLASHRNYISISSRRTAARAMAESGVEYALHQLRYGAWLAREKSFTYESPVIGEKGTFQVTVEEDGSWLVIRSVGKKEGSRSRYTATATVTNPSSILGYTLSVLNYDYDLHRPDTSALSVFGSDGVGSAGVIQELHTIKNYGEIELLATTDPAYAGISVGTDYVVDDKGFPFTRTDKVPIGKDRYFLDYASGRIKFSMEDMGRKVCIIYDYIRRLQPSAPYTIQLPYSPVRELSDEVFGMQRVPGPPTEKSQYQPNYRDGVILFSEKDAGAVLGVRYAFLGSRITGPVRVNGDVELDNTNLLYLFGSKGQRFSASGKIDFGSNSRVIVWNDNGTYDEVRSGGNPLLVEKANPFALPALDIATLRRRAKRGEGGAVYYDNRKDVEFPDLRPEDDEEAEPAPVERIEPPLDWPGYMARLYEDWTVMGSEKWKGGVYEPPGKVINLSSISPKDGKGNDILVFAEGNIILTGSLPEGRHAVIASNRNIYIGDSISGARTSSLMLFAEGNICLNLTRLQPQLFQARPITFYMNCVAFAKRGGLCVIPGGGANNRAVFHGSFFVNHLYPNAEWAKAFSSIDWIYDPTFSRPPRLPSGLLGIVKWD